MAHRDAERGDNAGTPCGQVVFNRMAFEKASNVFNLLNLLNLLNVWGRGWGEQLGWRRDAALARTSRYVR